MNAKAGRDKRESTHQLVQHQIVDLDVSRTKLRVYLCTIKLPWLKEMSKGSLQHKGQKPALDVGWDG